MARMARIGGASQKVTLAEWHPVELKDHHPDVYILYNRVKFELSRYDVGGKVTDRDVEVAKRIEHEHASLK